jgi:2-polyprenyl-3-methyl-5-hydroxy-6-metoxy-1,4-benzoquinol methylase
VEIFSSFQQGHCFFNLSRLKWMETTLDLAIGDYQKNTLICNRMFDYRKTLYNNYYSNHVGSSDQASRKALFEQQKRYLTREIIPLIEMKTSVRILDIGCGNGTLVSALHDAGYGNAQGIDLSTEQIEVGKSLGVKKIEVGQAESFLTQTDKKYDVIFAIDVLEHLSKDEAVRFLKLVYTSLDASGKCVMRVPNMDAPQSAVFAHADLTHELFLNKSSALQLFKSTGFGNVSVFPSLVLIEHPLKELLRKVLSAFLILRMKLELFATGRIWDKVVFTPNLIVVAKK